jgi:hypothetical protein
MNNIGAVKYIVVGAVVAIALIGFAIAYPMLTSQGNTGVLALQITDPPVAPPGVTSIIIAYSNVYVHISNAGQNSGWRQVAGSGSIDLMTVVNVTQTLGETPIPDGVYNAIRFNITSASITYNGTTYPANVPSGWIFAPLHAGSLSVTSTYDVGAVIDMAPTVIMSNDAGTLHFVIMPVVRGYPVPGAFSKTYERIGARESKATQTYLKADEFQDMGRIVITSATLTPTSLTVNVKNIGSTNVTLTHVILWGISQYSLTSGNTTVYGELRSYQMFAVESNASLEAVTNKQTIMAQWQAGQLGYYLTPSGTAGSTISLSYSNSTGIKLINPTITTLETQGLLVTQTISIIAGDYYGVLVGGFFEAQYATPVQAS